MHDKNKVIPTLKVATFVLLGWYFVSISVNPLDEWHFIDSVNLIFHEAGHAIFFFLGDFVQIAGGSLMQVLIPASVTYYFYKRKEYFSACVVLFWVGQSLVNISVYAGDAVAMQLPLLGGEGVIHDWNYLLSTLNMLSATPIVSEVFFLSGFALYIIAVYFGIYEAVGKTGVYKNIA
jgi:hypothetical protein